MVFRIMNLIAHVLVSRRLTTQKTSNVTRIGHFPVSSLPTGYLLLFYPVTMKVIIITFLSVISVCLLTTVGGKKEVGVYMRDDELQL